MNIARQALRRRVSPAWMTRVTPTTTSRLLLRADARGVWWSVVAANGRVLGTAAEALPDVVAARTWFLALCPLLPDLPVTFGLERGAREWTWRVGDAESGQLARSQGRYERHATARASFARFVAAATELCAAGAPVGPARPGQR